MQDPGIVSHVHRYLRGEVSAIFEEAPRCVACHLLKVYSGQLNLQYEVTSKASENDEAYGLLPLCCTCRPHDVHKSSLVVIVRFLTSVQAMRHHQ